MLPTALGGALDQDACASCKSVVRLLAQDPHLLGQGTLHARQQTEAIVRTKEVMHKLFSTMATRYRERNGGYCRVLRTRIRQNDAAQMAYIE